MDDKNEFERLKLVFGIECLRHYMSDWLSKTARPDMKLWADSVIPEIRTLSEALAKAFLAAPTKEAVVKK